MATDRSIHFWKRDLRSQMKRRLRELQKEQYEAKSAKICHKVTNSFASANVVAAFASSRFEPNLETLWTQGFFVRRIALYPKIDGNNLVFCPCGFQQRAEPGPTRNSRAGHPADTTQSGRHSRTGARLQQQWLSTWTRRGVLRPFFRSKLYQHDQGRDLFRFPAYP